MITYLQARNMQDISMMFLINCQWKVCGPVKDNHFTEFVNLCKVCIAGRQGSRANKRIHII